MRRHLLTCTVVLLAVCGFRVFAAETLHPLGLKFSDPRQNPNLVNVSSLTLKVAAGGGLPITVDLSAQMPPVGNQGSQGSCVGWAFGYYHKTHTEWVEHHWDIKLPQNQFSPAFLYNLMNGGSDSGARFDDATKIIVDNGVATLSAMPYSQADYTTWPSESAFEGALQFRGMTANFVYVTDDNGLNTIKTQLANGYTAVLGINVYGNFDNISTYKNTYCVANLTGSNRGGHAVTFVGYDDTMTTADGKGAFKMVNSWGTSWGDKGYWWMSYQAVKTGPMSQLSAYYITDRTAYTPLLIARAQLTHSARTRVGIQFGFGPTSAPRGAKTFFNFAMSTNTNRAFPGSNMVFDLSDNMASIGPDSLMFLRCNDKLSDGITGTITYFSAELGGTSKVSTDPPVTIPDYNTAAYATLKVQTIIGKHLSKTPDSLRFGTVWVGGNSNLQLTLANIGNDTTTISTLSLASSVFSHNAALPLKVPPYGSRTIAVTFSPSSAGVKIDTLKITSNAIDNPLLKISLKGAGVMPPAITVSPSSFKKTAISGDSLYDTLRISNTGGDSLSLSIAAPSWVWAVPVFGKIGPGSQGKVAVKFKTAGLAAGIYTNALGISHNAPQPASPISVPCTLTVQTEKRLSALPASLEFGSCWKADDSTLAITLSNSGADTTTIGAITLKNAVFSHNITTPRKVPPRTSITLLATFRPDSLKEEFDTLRIFSDAIDNSVIAVPLHGTGVLGPAITAAPAYLHENVFVGDSMTTLLRISNGGGDTLRGGIQVSPAAVSWLSVSPLSVKIAPRAYTDLSVKMNAESLLRGLYTGVLAISHNAPGIATPCVVPCTLTVYSMLDSGSLRILGLDSSAGVYLHATTGWLGVKQFNGNGTMVSPPGAYRAAVAQKNKRTEYVPLTVRPHVCDTVTITMHATVPVSFDTVTRVKFASNSDINIGSPGCAVMDDINHDGKEELVTLSWRGVLSIFSNSGGLQSPPAVFDLGLFAGDTARSLRIIDSDGDGVIDYLVGLSSGAIVKINGKTFAGSTIYTAQSGLTSVDLCDFNGDNAFDLLIGYADGTMDCVASDGTGGWRTPAPMVTDSLRTPLTVGSDASGMCMALDADSLPDLLIGNRAGQIVWFKRKADASYHAQGAAIAGGSPMALSGRAGLSFGYGAVGRLPKAVMTDKDGFVYLSQECLTGDFDGDGTVGFSDYMLFVNAWNTVEGDPLYTRKANLVVSPTGPQRIDFFDYMRFISVWNLDLTH